MNTTTDKGESAPGEFKFPKSQRLSKKKPIEQLFAEGKAFNQHPLRIIFLPNQDQSAESHQVLFSVSTRNFKRATDRNLLKRRMREAYRLNRHRLQPTSKLLLAYIYISKELLPFRAIEEKMVQSFERLK